MTFDELIVQAADHKAWHDSLKGDRPMEKYMKVDPAPVLAAAKDAKRYELLRELICSDDGEHFIRVFSASPFATDTPKPEEIDACLDAEVVRRAADAQSAPA